MVKILGYKVFPEFPHEKFVYKFTPKKFSQIFAKLIAQNFCTEIFLRIFACKCVHIVSGY